MDTSFRSWIQQHIDRDDPVGRFARDVQADSKAPEGSSMEQWLDHLALNNAGSGARSAFEQAWKEFSAAADSRGANGKVMLLIRSPQIPSGSGVIA